MFVVFCTCAKSDKQYVVHSFVRTAVRFSSHFRFLQLQHQRPERVVSIFSFSPASGSMAASPKQYQCEGCDQEYVHSEFGRISETEWRCYLCIVNQRMKNIQESGKDEEKARTKDEWIVVVKAEIAKQKRQKHRARGQVFQEALTEINAQAAEGEGFEGRTLGERKKAKQLKVMSLFNKKLNTALARGFMSSTVFQYFSDFSVVVAAVAEREDLAQSAEARLEEAEKALDDFVMKMAGRSLTESQSVEKKLLEDQVKEATAALESVNDMPPADTFVTCSDQPEKRRKRLLGPTGYLAYCDKGFWENQADGEGRDIMRIFYLPARNDCGCYFASALWRYIGKYKCAIDWTSFQKIFPDDHAALVTKYGDEASLHLAAERSSALCGTNYRPYADGPGMMIEILVGEEWQALVSEVLPAEVMNRFAQAFKADWLKLSTLTEEELWEKILETAVHPQTHLTELIPGMSRKVLGVFPLKDWKAAGGQPITQRAWLKWFIAMANFANDYCSDAKFPSLIALKLECEKFCK